MSQDLIPARGEVGTAQRRMPFNQIAKLGLYAVVAAIFFFAGMLTEKWAPTNRSLEATSDSASTVDLTPQDFASMVLIATNVERVKAGLTPLEESNKLNDSASRKLTHMLTEDYWEHIAPDGTTPWDFISDVGYSYENAGENLARDFTTPSAVVEGWMKSPTHRENMMAAGYTEMGIAVQHHETGLLTSRTGWTVVAHYATPR